MMNRLVNEVLDARPSGEIMPRSRSVNSKAEERLLELHRKHLGLYHRVAKSLSVSPTYVSQVANGKKRNDKIMTALLEELRKIE